MLTAVPESATVPSADPALPCCAQAPPIAEVPGPDSTPGCDRTAGCPGGDCDCPVQDAAVESSPPLVASPMTTDTVRIDRTAPTVVATSLEAPTGARRRPALTEPPPGPPVRLVFSVFLC